MSYETEDSGTVPLPDFLREERSWQLNQSPVANYLINHTYAMKPPKNPKQLDSESFQVGKHVDIK